MRLRFLLHIHVQCPLVSAHSDSSPRIKLTNSDTGSTTVSPLHEDEYFANEGCPGWSRVSFFDSMDVSFVLFSCSCFLWFNSVLTPVKTSQSFPKSNQAQDHPRKTLHRIHLDGILQVTLLVHYHLLNRRA